MKHSVVYVLFVVITGFSVTANAAVSSIDQLDNACAFSFAVFSDNRSEIDQNVGRAFSWIKANHEFCIGNGDIFDDVDSKNDAFLELWKNDSFWHKNLYPTFGNRCSRMNKGSQANWGPPAYTLDYLDQTGWTFRTPTEEKIWGHASKEDHTPYPYEDQKIDYYVKRKIGDFTVHLIIVYSNDRAPFAHRSADFLLSTVKHIAPDKSSHDIVVLASHVERWLWRSCRESFWDKGDPHYNGNPLARSEAEYLLENSDLVVASSDHRFRRLHDTDNWNTSSNQALSVDTGQVYKTGSKEGYLEVHVFDHPPRFTVQYISAAATRALHVGVHQPSADRIKTDRGETETLCQPMLKYVNGPMIQPLDWNNFELPAPKAETIVEPEK